MGRQPKKVTIGSLYPGKNLGRRTSKRRISIQDLHYLRGEDISECQRCGGCETVVYWPVVNGVTLYEEPMGVLCRECFWHCGAVTLLDMLEYLADDFKCRVEKLKYEIDRKRGKSHV